MSMHWKSWASALPMLEPGEGPQSKRRQLNLHYADSTSPPSMRSAEPVVQRARGETRKAISAFPSSCVRRTEKHDGSEPRPCMEHVPESPRHGGHHAFRSRYQFDPDCSRLRSLLERQHHVGRGTSRTDAARKVGPAAQLMLDAVRRRDPEQTAYSQGLVRGVPDNRESTSLSASIQSATSWPGSNPRFSDR
jgi:hypothetical protein